MKNGGMISKAGNLLIATAAKAYSVPIIVLASAIKLTPHFPFE
jgi:translation initiation factor 2B subunit (eIF-2B alpha/beta/delta family)